MSTHRPAHSPTHRPSVLFLSRTYPPQRGAAGRLLRDLAKAMARQGWEVTVVTTAPKASRERDGSIRLLRIKAPDRPAGLRAHVTLWLKMAMAAMQLPRSDLVVTLSDPLFLPVAGRILARRHKARHIHWCHSLYPDMLAITHPRLRGMLRWFVAAPTHRALMHADRVIATGRCMAHRLVQNGIEPKRISFIPNWPDSALERPAEPAILPASLTINAKPHEDQHKDGPKFRVLYAGNIGRAHDMQTMLGAAEILQPVHPEIEFVFVGDGAHFDTLAAERTRRHLDNVRLMPFQPSSRLREVLESGDLHLISLRSEAAGLTVPCKLYAALAVGRPFTFVGPTQSEITKIIQDFKAGTHIPPGQSEQLAETIRQYRMDPDVWFAAKSGAEQAGQVFLPAEAMEAWMQRAWETIKPAGPAHSSTKLINI